MDYTYSPKRVPRLNIDLVTNNGLFYPNSYCPHCGDLEARRKFVCRWSDEDAAWICNYICTTCGGVRIFIVE